MVTFVGLEFVFFLKHTDQIIIRTQLHCSVHNVFFVVRIYTSAHLLKFKSISQDHVIMIIITVYITKIYRLYLYPGLDS